jgi:hypothetical protein
VQAELEQPALRRGDTLLVLVAPESRRQVELPEQAG